MMREWKICLAPFKMTYALLFVILLSLVRGITDIAEIGRAVDSNMALLAIIICADVYVMEYRGKRWEVFKLYPLKSRTKAIYRRLGIQFFYLSLLSYAGYWLFYWQKPVSMYEIPSVQLYVMYLAAVTVTLIFWGMLSVTITNLCSNMWAGIGISLIFWMAIYSKQGDVLLGKWSVFAFSFCQAEDLVDWSWIWGKCAALALAAAMFMAVPAILKKRG